MKKIRFSDLSLTTKKLILHTARDLPFGRFLACVSPSACRQIMEPDVKLGRTFSHDLQIFCEQVSRLCRDDSWAKNYLLEGQSPNDYPHLLLARTYSSGLVTCNPKQIECDVAERMYKYLMFSLEFEQGVCCGTWYSDFSVKRIDRIRQFSIHFGARQDEEKGVMSILLHDPVNCFDDILEIAIIVGAIQDVDGGKVVRSKNRISDFCIDAEFPLAVPKFPEGKEPSLYGSEREVEVYKNCTLWREAIKVETEKVFRAHGLGFVFEA